MLSCPSRMGVLGGDGSGVLFLNILSSQTSISLKAMLSCIVSNERRGGQKRRISETGISSSALYVCSRGALEDRAMTAVDSTVLKALFLAVSLNLPMRTSVLIRQLSTFVPPVKRLTVWCLKRYGNRDFDGNERAKQRRGK
jgi:hypothetical protein